MDIKALLKGKTGVAGGGTVLGVVLGLLLAMATGEDSLDDLLNRAQGEPSDLLAAGVKKTCALPPAAQIAAVESAREQLSVEQDVAVSCVVEESAESAPDSAEVEDKVADVVEQASEEAQEREEQVEQQIVDEGTEEKTE